MATSSFYEMMVIDTPESAQRLLEAFEEAEKRGPYKSGIDVERILDENKKHIKDLIIN